MAKVELKVWPRWSGRHGQGGVEGMVYSLCGVDEYDKAEISHKFVLLHNTYILEKTQKF